MNSADNNQYDLIVVGGGITGLVSAYLASRDGKKVAVVESANNFGGLLNTFEIAGTKLEFFYHHFFTHDAELNWLIKELEIDDKLIFRPTTMGVFRNKKIYPFNNITDLFKFKPINWVDKIKFGLTSMYLGKVATWKNNENISAKTWFEKWSGKSTAQSLWTPMLNIKFGPYAPVVPLAWMVGRMRQRLGSRKKGDERLGYLEGSLQVMLDALLAAMKKNNVSLLNNTHLERIEFENKEIKQLHFKGGNTLKSNQYLFTLPSCYFASFLQNELPEYAAAVNQIKYFGAICVVLELSKKLSDIYWLNIADDGYPFGGVIEHTNFVSPDNYQGKHIVYLSRYFAHEEDLATMSNEEVKKLMVSRLKDIYPEFDENSIINSFVFKTMTAAPVCDFNFSEKILDCKTPIKDLYMANMSHVYPDERGVNNSIRIAAEACRVMGMDTNYVPKNKSMSATIGF